MSGGCLHNWSVNPDSTWTGCDDCGHVAARWGVNVSNPAPGWVERAERALDAAEPFVGDQP